MTDRPTLKRKLTPRSPPPAPLPAGPWITRTPQGKGEVITFTDAGLVAVRMLAASGGSLGLISSRCNITKAALRKAMDNDERGRIAFESGIAEEEMQLVQSLRRKAEKGASAVPELFLLKTRHGFIEGAPPPSTAPSVVINLPDSYSPAEYLKLVNQPEPEITPRRAIVRKVAAPDNVEGQSDDH
jgi:hypothetical protein